MREIYVLSAGACEPPPTSAVNWPWFMIGAPASIPWREKLQLLPTTSYSDITALALLEDPLASSTNTRQCHR